METFFFQLIDILVSTIQGNPILDTFIEYVAYYHILYSGQLGIRLIKCIVLICKSQLPCGYNDSITCKYFVVRSIMEIVPLLLETEFNKSNENIDIKQTSITK